MRQTGYLPRPPTTMQPPEILHAWSCPGVTYFKAEAHENRLRDLGAMG